nr:angiotensinogen [Pelodiscus sinensis]XP_025039861.1 angiotensinogen [Pelodiscus sinensis]XP_025039862.1 angiotensinogen [Pelodiscus sinensis]|eukprot:XP_006122058.1 angiotensinogen [Pelodiscus sinensis]
MNPRRSLLCFFLCLSPVMCDRVYVHPFHLFSYNKSSCENLVNLMQEEKMFVPVSIESQTIPAYEETLKDKTKLERQSSDIKGDQRLSYLKDLVYVLGMRFYDVLKETLKGENILLSPTTLYRSLLSFYLGASEQTADDLQKFLGFIPPSGDPDCTSKVDGHKVLLTLKTIENLPLSSGAGDLLFSKLSCLFSAPSVRLSESLVNSLAPSSDYFYARAVDFTNPSQAAELIENFVKDKDTSKSKNVLTNIDPSTTLLFLTYIQLKANVKKASQLKELQEFWVDSSTKILVPMMSATGMFPYKRDDNKNYSVIRVPVSENALLVLVQPVNSNDLNQIELELSLYPSSTWLQNLSPRYIKLSLPELTIESTYDLQELLTKMNLSTLLGKNANLNKISDASLAVGKVINKALFKLKNSGAEELLEENGDSLPLEIQLNKPFLLAVYEKNSKAMILLGRVTNPLNGV